MYGSFDWSSILGSMSFELTEEQIEALLAQMSDQTPKTYEDVLAKLGYGTLDEPSAISIYPNSFDGKEVVEQLIEDYNNQVDDEDDKVTYTDVIGIITASITEIIDTITYVLIAFVAISLIVSSIMIAIITYISVLERTKEIGVLRALGASKKDISKIFNAETFIEGLISGMIGIGTTLLLCIPINALVEEIVGVANIAVLPMRYAIVLIIISVVLTLLAGFVPARMAAKKDPVTALRSE
jgi:ABC-type antimicrobial peptide transport system permease subunit